MTLSNYLVAIVSILGMLCALLAIYTDHRKTIAMIKQGMKPKETSLVSGLVVLAVGLGLLASAYTTLRFSNPDLKNGMIIGGIMSSLIGLAILISLKVIKKG